MNNIYYLSHYISNGTPLYGNVIGIELLKTSIIQAGSLLAYKLVDIIVSEIPYKACIHNINGAHIIDRVPTNTNADYIIEHEPDMSFKKGYFFPISLNKLSILIRESSDSSTTYNSANNSFIFRLTILNNLELMK